MAAPVGRPGADLGEGDQRVVTEGISPEQVVDEAIVRIKQILSGSE
jgi:hypothetical protein